MNNKILYEGWLNEAKMVNVLTNVVEKNGGKLLQCGYKENSKKYKHGTQIKLPESRSYFDFGFIQDEIKYLVEFDGNYQGVGHYNNAENSYKDYKKNELAKKHQYKLIRIPFWLQLDNKTFEIFFGFKSKLKIENNFPHGFITNSCLNPASFCKLGLDRFLKELEMLTDEIRNQVLISLIVKSDRLNIPLNYVWDDDRLIKVKSINNYQVYYDKIKEFANEWNLKNK